GTGSGFSRPPDARSHRRPLRASLREPVPLHRRPPGLRPAGAAAFGVSRLLLALVAAANRVDAPAARLSVRVGAARTRAAGPSAGAGNAETAPGTRGAHALRQRVARSGGGRGFLCTGRFPSPFRPSLEQAVR